MRITVKLLFAFFIAFFATAATVSAQDYPSGTVSFIVAYAPGGGSDVSARNFEPYLQKALNTSIAIINKPGGNGEVGFAGIAKAKPDGYTIGIINLPVFFINLYTRSTTYSFEDFEILAPMGGSEHTIGVPADSKIQNLEDLIRAAKEKPGVLTIGSSGNFSDDYLAYLLFEKEIGIELIHVPFKGAGPARTAVLGGHTDLIAFNVDEAIPFVQSGQIRLLGVMSEARAEQLPDVPTFKEQGYAIVSSSSRAIVGPRGMPENVSAILKKTLKEALVAPEHLESVRKMGQTFEWAEPDVYLKQLEQEAAQTKKLLEATQ